MKRVTVKGTQAGIGLVEIMVALVIGLFLVGGLTQIFLGNKQGFRVQEAQSRLQENTRLVSVLLSSGIGKAEFQENGEEDPRDAFGAALTITGTDGGGTTPDTITIRFEGDDVMTDCLGGIVAADTVSINTYRVGAGSILQCNDNSGVGFRSLVDDIANMQILYGEDTNANGSVDQYVNAGAVTNFNNVLSVHVALLLASSGDVKPAATVGNYTLLGTAINTPADRVQRRVVERVIALRSRLL